MSPELVAQKGTVYLVGAGPGRPDLLTVRAAALLASADVVAYDELVPMELVEAASLDARLVAVGRRARRTEAPAHRLHPAVLEHARLGRSVVRLKAGDPLVFGRGGEEAEELRAAGVPFEIVPGVSSALGAASWAGIPLTHRDYASDVSFVSGHDLLSARTSRTCFEALGRGRGTLVLFMGARSLGANLERLVAAGRAPETPAALVGGATTSRQTVIEGTLATLAQNAQHVDPDVPALIIIGDVVKVRAHAHWWATRPLAGRRLLLGRARPGPSALATHLRELGATVVEAPHVRTAPPSSWVALDAATDDLGAFDLVLVTSETAASAWLARLSARARDVRLLAPLPLVALGAAAARALARCGLRAEATTRGDCDAALDAVPSLSRGRRVLVLAGEGERASLTASLLGRGLHVTTAATHVVERHPLRLPLGPVDAVLVPASSAASIVRLVPDPKVPILAMGPLAGRAARAAGAAHVLESERDSREGLVDLVLRTLSPSSAPSAEPRAGASRTSPFEGSSHAFIDHA